MVDLAGNGSARMAAWTFLYSSSMSSGSIPPLDELAEVGVVLLWLVFDGYYVAYKPITLSCILFMFIEMKFIHCHSCVMFAMKSMSMCNDYVNYDEIII